MRMCFVVAAMVMVLATDYVIPQSWDDNVWWDVQDDFMVRTIKSSLSKAYNIPYTLEVGLNCPVSQREISDTIQNTLSKYNVRGELRLTRPDGLVIQIEVYCAPNLFTTSALFVLNLKDNTGAFTGAIALNFQFGELGIVPYNEPKDILEESLGISIGAMASMVQIASSSKPTGTL